MASSQGDTKAALVAGVAATAAQFLASRTNLNADLAAVAFALYAVSFLSAVASYAVARFMEVPNPRSLVEEFVFEKKHLVLASLIATRVDAFEFNLRVHRRKVRLWWLSVAGLVAGLYLAVVATVHT